MITILIGDVANSVPEHAQLLTESNKQLAPGMYYASLADFSSYRSFVDTLDQADHIVYAPPHSWSDQNKQGISYMKIWTEHCLFYFNDKKLVTGASFATPVDDQQILKLSDTRKSNDQQLIFPLKTKHAIDKLGLDMNCIEAIIDYIIKQLHIDSSEHEVISCGVSFGVDGVTVGV
jgi:hypothetical protein